MPDTTSYEFGDVVLVPFSVADSMDSVDTAKQRPAVVVSGNAYNAEAVVLSENEHYELVMIMGITSVRGALGVISLADWSAEGLLHPSYIKPAITTIAQSRVLRKLGKLTMADLNPGRSSSSISTQR